jgi:hypothetical protein
MLLLEFDSDIGQHLTNAELLSILAVIDEQVLVSKYSIDRQTMGSMSPKDGRQVSRLRFQGGRRSVDARRERGTDSRATAMLIPALLSW